MKVAIMGRILGYDGSGIQRLLMGLLHAMGQISLPHEIVVFMEPGQKVPEILKATPLEFIPVGSDTGSASSRMWWDHVAVGRTCRKLQVDVLYAPAHVRPIYSPCPAVVMVPDMMYHRFPEFWQWQDQAYFRLMVSAATRHAAKIAVLSESTKRDLLSLSQVPTGKVEVVYPGVPNGYRPVATEERVKIVRQYELQEPFVLFVGSFHPRKNLKGLLDAFAQISEEIPHKLVIVGSRWKSDDILEHSQRTSPPGRVRFLHYVPEPDLPSLYGAADLFVYPSLYEGFGFPVLEAMACGCPTITTNISSLPEVAGDAAVLVPPDDTPSLAQAIHTVLVDAQQQAGLRQRALEQAQRFSWARAVRQMLRLLEEAASREHGGAHSPPTAWFSSRPGGSK